MAVSVNWGSSLGCVGVLVTTLGVYVGGPWKLRRGEIARTQI